jgi:hypothetical protein
MISKGPGTRLRPAAYNCRFRVANRPEARCITPPPRPLHVPNSPPTHQTRDVRLHDPFNAGHAMESCRSEVDILRPRRLRERNRHAGGFWRPSACLMADVAGRGGGRASRSRRVKGVLAIILARGRSLGAIDCYRQAAQLLSFVLNRQRGETF